jgi:DNA repair protein RadC
LFSPREIFKDALRYNASSVILIHNHPSGNPKPSDSDLRTTAELSRIGKELGIQILDHIVIGRNGYESISSIISMK